MASILSVGIDVGTTSTHLTLSRLDITNSSLKHQAPQAVISSREIFYQSDIHFTPLTNDGAIDGTKVAAIIADEYHKARVQKKDIQSGAVIVTGETACLRNAPAIVEALASLAGDFVVASAGPHFESILAGRGSGAAAASLERKQTILNVDIGGGTTNLAVFSQGKVLDTACIGIGGRFLSFSPQGEVSTVSNSGDTFLNGIAKTLTIGDQPSIEQLKLLGQLLAEAIVEGFLSCRPPQISRRLFLTATLRHDYKIDELWLSGGVAELMQSLPADPLQFYDMGGYLAMGLIEALACRNLSFHIPIQPIRATVIGAGLHSMQLSGSTISVSQDLLPIKNLPLIRPFADLQSNDELSSAIKLALNDCLKRHDLDWSSTQLALVIDQSIDANFNALKNWASGLASAFQYFQAKEPLLLLLTKDVAMAVGQLLQTELPEEKFIVLDGIALEHGDYIDIGLPIADGYALPVVIKTLAFQYQ